MKARLLFGTGLAAGFVLGSRSGRAAYEKLKARAAGLWESKPVQDKVAAATEAVKEKAPEVSGQLTEAARRAGTVISSAVHRDDSSADDGNATPATGSGSAIPAHSTHPGTPNLGSSGGVQAAGDLKADDSGSDTPAEPGKH